MNNRLMVNTIFSKKNGFYENKSDAIDLLQQIIYILNEYGIDYFLISGTLLGYVRHNDFIPWDDDLDLVVDIKLIKKLPLINKKYSEKLNFFNHEFMVKSCFKDKVINLNAMKKWRNTKESYFWPFIDLFTYKYSSDRSTIDFFGQEWKADEFFPASKAKFVTIENVLIPKNPQYFLSQY